MAVDRFALAPPKPGIARWLLSSAVMSRSVLGVLALVVAVALSAALSNDAGAANPTCKARVTNPHAANYTEAQIVVQTKPGARVTELNMLAQRTQRKGELRTRTVWRTSTSRFLLLSSAK